MLYVIEIPGEASLSAFYARYAEWKGYSQVAQAPGRLRLFLDSLRDVNVGILECDPPHRFLAHSGEGATAMRVFAHLREAGGMTTLTFGQRLANPSDAATMGPGWDYYLDRLAAVRLGRTLPEWEEYFPALSRHYEELHVPQDATRH